MAETNEKRRIIGKKQTEAPSLGERGRSARELEVISEIAAFLSGKYLVECPSSFESYMQRRWSCDGRSVFEFYVLASLQSPFEGLRIFEAVSRSVAVFGQDSHPP